MKRINTILALAVILGLLTLVVGGCTADQLAKFDEKPAVKTADRVVDQIESVAKAADDAGVDDAVPYGGLILGAILLGTAAWKGRNKFLKRPETPKAE